MTTPQDVLRRHDKAVRNSATELVRRFGKDQELLAQAAHAWCEHFSVGYQELDEPDKFVAPEEDAPIYQLLELALKTTGLFADWLHRARTEHYHHGKKQLVPKYSRPMLSFMLALWPARSAMDNIAALAASWGRAAHDPARLDVAAHLHDYPDLAFGILGPLRYEPEARARCERCGRSHSFEICTGAAHLLLVAERSEQKDPPDPRDEEVLRAIPPEALLRDRQLRDIMLSWVHSGARTPSSFWATVERLVDSDAWALSVTFLLNGDAGRRAQGINRLAREVVTSAAPLTCLDFLDFAAPFASGGVFTGPGWGREERPRHLLPLSRTLLTREVWPSRWSRWLRQRHTPEVDEDTQRERAIEAEREVLAEALLELVLNRDLELARREKALEALRALRPGGNGSWVKALSRLKGTELEVRALEVQKDLRQRGVPTDADLAIGDALETLFGHRPAIERKPY